MRVAFILDSFPTVSETFIINQIIGLIKEGVYVQIVAENYPVNKKVHQVLFKYKVLDKCIYEPQLNGSLLTKINSLLVLAFKVSLKAPRIFLKLFGFEGKFFNIRYLKAVTPFIDNSTFDIIHAHFGPYGVKAFGLKKLGVIKSQLICTFHGYDVDNIKYIRNPSFYSDLFKHASSITSNSNYTSHRLIQLGCPEEKIRYLPVSVDTNLFKLKSNRRNNNKLKIITIARLVEFKGIEYSIRSVEYLIKKGYTNIHHEIIGEGPLKKPISELIKSKNLNNYIELLDARNQEEIYNHLQEADIFLLTGIVASDGRQENQGLVIQEAQSMELPVVVSDVGGVSQGLIDNITGFLVPQKDFITAANKLEALVKNYDLRIKMGYRGREFVKQNFDIDILTNKLIAIYKEALSS